MRPAPPGADAVDPARGGDDTAYTAVSPVRAGPMTEGTGSTAVVFSAFAPVRAGRARTPEGSRPRTCRSSARNSPASAGRWSGAFLVACARSASSSGGTPSTSEEGAGTSWCRC